MKEELSACELGNDLVSFLYGELDKGEAEAFQQHLSSCSGCSAELAGFSDIRAAVGDWRTEALGGATNIVTPLPSTPQRSAVAAIRQFFDLSPLWMKGAVGFAGLLLCLLTVLAIANWRATSTTSVAVDNPEAKYTDQQVKEMVQKEVERVRNSQAPTPAPVIVAGDSPGVQPRGKARRTASISNASTARRPLSRTEREELAKDLRLAGPLNETDIELLEDKLNE